MFRLKMKALYYNFFLFFVMVEEFYGRNDDYEQSDKLLNMGYDLCKKRHVIYFAARILYQLAQNNIAENGSPQRLLNI